MRRNCFRLTFRVESPHVPGLVGVEGSDLDLVAQDRIRILFEEHFVDGHVHGGDDLLGIADQLAVEVFIVQPDVAGVDAQVGLLQIVDLQNKMSLRLNLRKRQKS